MKFICVILQRGEGGEVNTSPISSSSITTSRTTTPSSFTRSSSSSSITNISSSNITVAIPNPWDLIPKMDPLGPFYSSTTPPTT